MYLKQPEIRCYWTPQWTTKDRKGMQGECS